MFYSSIRRLKIRCNLNICSLFKKYLNIFIFIVIYSVHKPLLLQHHPALCWGNSYLTIQEPLWQSHLHHLNEDQGLLAKGCYSEMNGASLGSLHTPHSHSQMKFWNPLQKSFDYCLSVWVFTLEVTNVQNSIAHRT